MTTQEPGVSDWWADLAPAVEDVLARADELLSSLPPTLDRLRAAFLRRLDGASRPGSWRGLPANVDLFPLLPLQLWLADALGLPRDARAVIDVAAGSWLAYCAVRITDDVIDDADEIDRAWLLLCDHHRWAFEAVLREMFPPGHTFWSNHRRRWLDYSAVTAGIEERAPEDWSPPTEAQGEETGHKVVPAAIPLDAIAHLGDRADLLDDLERGVLHLGVSVQLINDLAGLEEDFDRGRWSIATATVLGGDGRGVPIDSARFWKRLLVRPGVLPLLDRAIQEQSLAHERLSRAIEWPAGLDAYLAARAQRIRGHRDLLFRQAMALGLSGGFAGRTDSGGGA